MVTVCAGYFYTYICQVSGRVRVCSGVRVRVTTNVKNHQQNVAARSCRFHVAGHGPYVSSGFRCLLKVTGGRYHAFNLGREHVGVSEEHFFLNKGVPEILVSDNGAQFR